MGRWKKEDNAREPQLPPWLGMVLYAAVVLVGLTVFGSLARLLG